jgi:hypothetical protein
LNVQGSLSSYSAKLSPASLSTSKIAQIETILRECVQDDSCLVSVLLSEKGERKKTEETDIDRNRVGRYSDALSFSVSGTGYASSSKGLLMHVTAEGTPFVLSFEDVPPAKAKAPTSSPSKTNYLLFGASLRIIEPLEVSGSLAPVGLSTGVASPDNSDSNSDSNRNANANAKTQAAKDENTSSTSLTGWLTRYWYYLVPLVFLASMLVSGADPQLQNRAAGQRNAPQRTT